MPRVSDRNGRGLQDYSIPLRPTQLVTVSFVPTSHNKDASAPGTQIVTVVVTTSDQLPVAYEARVTVTDLLTGTAVPDTDYTTFVDDELVFAAGTLNGASQTTTLDILGNNQDRDIDLGLIGFVQCVPGYAAYRCNLEAGGGGGGGEA